MHPLLFRIATFQDTIELLGLSSVWLYRLETVLSYYYKYFLGIFSVRPLHATFIEELIFYFLVFFVDNLFPTALGFYEYLQKCAPRNTYDTSNYKFDKI